MLGKLVDDVHRPAIEQAKIGASRVDRDVGNRVHEPIEQRGREPLEGGNVLGVFAHRKHDLEAFLPLGHHFRKQARRMLKIGIHGDDAIAAGAPQPGAKRGLVPEIAGQPDIFDAGIGFRCRLDDLEGAIDASVVHDDDLMQPGGQSASNRIEQYRQVRFFIVGWDDDRNFHECRSRLYCGSCRW